LAFVPALGSVRESWDFVDEATCRDQNGVEVPRPRVFALLSKKNELSPDRADVPVQKVTWPAEPVPVWLDEPKQTPPTAKHPPAISIPLLKVEVALPVTAREVEVELVVVDLSAVKFWRVVEELTSSC
jgi:hypothetical protein